MNNSGRAAAVEPIRGRFHRMQANLSRWRNQRAVLYARRSRCGSCGAGQTIVCCWMRRVPRTRMRWQDIKTSIPSLRKVRETQRKQKSLLRSAYAALKPMACCFIAPVFTPEENELVVEALPRKTDAQLLPIENAPQNSVPGLTHWSGKSLSSQPQQSLRICPTAYGTDLSGAHD